MSFLYAHLCAECIPKGKDAFFRLATRISLNRELAGVHFPSDTQAGIVLGRQLFEIMLVNPAARKLIDDARG
jgi:membrane-associated phospholipid phosphatase